MAKFGNGKGSFSDFIILNAILHLFSTFLSYPLPLPLALFDHHTLSAFQKEIYQIFGTIFWLFLSQLLRFRQLQTISQKISSKLSLIWFAISFWIRIIFLFGVLVGMIGNDYLRIAICSYLSALSINQYQRSQQSAIHYSSQSVITTTDYPEVIQQKEILPFNAPPSAVSIDMQRSSDFGSLRHRRGTSRTSQSILPTHVTQSTPVRKTLSNSADRFNQQPISKGFPTPLPKPVHEIPDRQSDTPPVDKSQASTKRKLDDVEVEDGLRNDVDEAPAKKRDINGSHSDRGLISGLISRLPNWRTIFPSQPPEVLPTEKIPKSSSEFTSNSANLLAEIDSKKRQRPDESTKEESQKLKSEDPANESEDEIVGIRKIPRRAENSSPLMNRQKLETVSVTASEEDRKSIYLSQPHIPLRPPQLVNHSSQREIDQATENPQKSQSRPVLRSRHAVSMEQYSKKRSLSFELEDSQEKDTGQDRLIAAIHSNRQQMLEATENLLKGVVSKKDEKSKTETETTLKNANNFQIGFTSFATSSLSQQQQSEKHNSSTFNFQSEKQIQNNDIATTPPSIVPNTSLPLVFGSASSSLPLTQTPKEVIDFTSPSSTTPPISDKVSPDVINSSPSEAPPSTSNLQLDKVPSSTMKKPPPSPTVRKTSFDDKRNGIAFLPTNLTSLPSAADSNTPPTTLSFGTSIRKSENESSLNTDTPSSSAKSFSFSSSTSAIATPSFASTSPPSMVSTNPPLGFGSKSSTSTFSFGSQVTPSNTNINSTASSSEHSSSNLSNPPTSSTFNSFGSSVPGSRIGTSNLPGNASSATAAASNFSSFDSGGIGAFGKQSIPPTFSPSPAATSTSSGFSFGQQSNLPTPSTGFETGAFGSKSEKTSSVSFSSNPSSTTSSSPSFGGGGFAFGSKSASTSAPANTGFSFGGSTTSSAPAPNPGFGFSQSSAPTPSFGTTSSQPTGPFSSSSTFGSSVSTPTVSGPFGGSNNPANSFSSSPGFNTSSPFTNFGGGVSSAGNSGFSIGSDQKSERKKVKPKFHVKK